MNPCALLFTLQERDSSRDALRRKLARGAIATRPIAR